MKINNKIELNNELEDGCILYIDDRCSTTWIGHYRLVFFNNNNKYQLFALDCDKSPLIPMEYDNIQEIYDYYKDFIISIYTREEYELTIKKSGGK